MFDSWKLSAIVSFACLLAAQAKAQTIAKQFVDLKYDIDPTLQGCPTALEFRSIVAQELGYDPYLAGSSMGLAIRVRSTETGIEGVINWGNAAEKKGERRFAARTEDCRAMMTTVGFVVAVQIQLMASKHIAEPNPLSAPTEADTRSDTPPSPRRAQGDGSEQAAVTLTMRSFELHPPPVSKGAGWITTVGAGPAIGVGLAPATVGLVGRLFGAVQRGWVGLELGAEASRATTTRQAYGGGFRHQLVLGTLAGCAWQGPISACALGKLGRVQVEGVGVDVPASPKKLVAEAGPRVAYSLGFDQHLILQGYVEALYSLTSWTVYVNHVAVWTIPRFATVAGIDLAARF